MQRAWICPTSQSNGHWQRRKRRVSPQTSFCASVLALPDLGEPFEFVSDIGCFHTLAKDQRNAFVAQLTRVTQPGSVYFLLCGNAKEPLDPGPPTVSEEEIRATFGRDFDIEWIRECRFDTVRLPKAPLGYATLMRRQ